MVRISVLRQIAARGKIRDVVDSTGDLLEAGEKVVLFVNLHDVVNELKKAFPKAVTVTGLENAAQKQAAVDSFQNNPATKLIICSIKAAGVGLTLTASSHVVFVEFPWTAGCRLRPVRGQNVPVPFRVVRYYHPHLPDTGFSSFLASMSGLNVHFPFSRIYAS
ncbi:MAG: SWF/SNF helicase family protein [Bacteroidales bacterium]|nr:SWF/SNF helicase family protein [Bacteroidales bacterium]